jgi:hypothetical protein
VHEARSHEESGRAMQRSPALVATQDAANAPHDGRLANGNHRASRDRRHHELPARDDRPQRKGHHADRADRTQRATESAAALRVGCQQDVRPQKHDACDGNPSVPDRSTVDPVEPNTSTHGGADQCQADRQKQHGLGAEQLADVAGGLFTRRFRHHPEHGVADKQQSDGHRPELTSGETGERVPPAQATEYHPGRLPNEPTRHCTPKASDRPRPSAWALGPDGSDWWVMAGEVGS